jgi:hypothetical protein
MFGHWIAEVSVTEAEWQVTTDVSGMLCCLREQHGARRRKAGKRKLRLFGCGCCRRLWDWMDDARSREAVVVAERLADGLARTGEVEEAQARAMEALQVANAASSAVEGGARGCDWPHASPRWAAQAAFCVLDDRLGNAAFVAVVPAPYPEHPTATTLGPMHRWQADALRCLFANPFRPIAVVGTWCTSTALALARQMYESRDFSAMPILADALQDAGCDNDDILSHCRGDGPHVRGCWVVDLVLGKE